MKNWSSVLTGLWLFALASTTLLTQLSHASAPSATAFTYQGQLRDGGTNANGTYSLVFKLYDAVSTGNQVGSTITLASQFVTNGQFNVTLDFGPVFDGSTRWLELTVNSSPLSPRTQIMPTPYAIHATTAGSVQNPSFVGTTGNTALELMVNSTRVLRLEPHEISPNIVGGYYGNVVSSGVFGATIAGGGGGLNDEDSLVYTNTVDGVFGTVGGGARNSVTGPGAVVAGGFNNQAGNDSATVAGGSDNVASGDAATIGGGKENIASASGSVVAGGSANQVLSQSSFIGGGNSNKVSQGNFSAVVGGKSNQASGNNSFIGGGISNVASGEYSMIIGGSENVASANFCFAGGTSARALHQGSFVWSSDGGSTFSSSGNGEFAVRAAGGFRFVCGPNSIAMLNNTVTIGNGDFRVLNGGATFAQAINAPGFNNTSDRNAKQDFTGINTREVLAKVAALPVQTWTFKNDPGATRHIGPMAQDFHAAFGVGTDERHIATVDADGVALAAIQGLNEIVKEKDAEILALKQRLELLEKSVSALVQSQSQSQSQKAEVK